MKIAIVGAGAVGSYYGVRLAAAGHEVHFLLRSDYEDVRRNGIRVHSVHGDVHLRKVNCYRDTRLIGPVDLVIVAWKTTSNHLAQEVISPLVGESTTLLTLQNGLGNVELLGELFGIQRVMAGLCFVCINRLAAGEISHTASGLTRLAWADRPCDEFLWMLVEDFKKAEIPCEGVDQLEKALWLKLIWNVPFNGLTIVEGGLDTEVLLSRPGLEQQVRDLMHEVIQVGRALGHDISYDLADKQIAMTRPMGPYRPSSMIDFVAGRPVEFEAIWLKPLRVALKLGLEVPHMRQLAKRLAHSLELEYQEMVDE